MTIQTGLRLWSDDDRPERTTGIDISCMAHAALEIEPPIYPESFDGELRERIFRTTEYAIRRTAPNTPDRPEDGTAYDPALDGRALEEQETETFQTNLAVATDGGTAMGDKSDR